MPRKLKLVTEHDQTKAIHKQEEESWKLTRTEIAERVHVIRCELEAAKIRYDGALFDNYTDGIPLSLDIVGVNKEPYGAVSYVAPSIKGRFDRLQDAGTKNVSDDVGELYFWGTEVAFSIGMLAGAIYADCPTATIDRFERGLAFAIAARTWEIKD